MKECDNSTRKIHISSNFILSISLLIMFDTLLLRPSLHCNTPLYFTTLHPTTLHYTQLHLTQLHFTTLSYTSPNYTSLHLSTLHFLSFTLHYPLIQLYPFTFPIFLFHFPSLNQTQYSSISPHITKLDTMYREVMLGQKTGLETSRHQI